jgi:hypothetical protein
MRSRFEDEEFDLLISSASLDPLLPSAGRHFARLLATKYCAAKFIKVH